MTWQKDWIQRFYRDRPGWIDGTAHFHGICAQYIRRDSAVLEVGAGDANPTSEFLSRKSGSVIGLDVDEGVKANPFLSSAVVYDGRRFPFPGGSFDVVVADYVLEHVDDPAALLAETHRVLRAGGALLFRTPNVLHYVSIAGRLFPDAVSVWARNRAPSHRVFPRRFRFNSEGTCRRMLAAAGFNVRELELIEKEPSYGMKSRFLFVPMMIYERLVNSTELLKHLRANILCAAVKP